ncbi:amino acid ABC transporter substrate-binding protein [Marinobacter lipolyticus]|uniref:substrate-binding periplasmic protein n=1 Tax=Marinobacter lipolyticus TaxID=209639 RepID=UPI001BCFCA1C|nr:transporter substrate-binding domain-containing protein [Marinobacter lipolyticus]MBS8241390.1 amino acid ABC transporter substrate-binding protein [Marinobacter lipolyticus]
MPNRVFVRPNVIPVLLLIFLALSLMAPAQRVSANEQSGKILHFNVSPNGYPPYLIVKDQQPAGIVWDVVSLIAERIGYQVVPKKVPRKRVDSMLLEGFIDGTPRAIEWTSNPDQFLFTDPIVAIEEVLFIPSTSKLVYQKPEDLFSRTLVTHLGYSYPLLEPYFESEKIKRFDVSRDRDMFTFVLHGQRFDAAVADRLVGQWILLNEGWQNEFRISEESISNFPFRLMLRKDWGDFAEQFNTELATIRESGELDAILSRYR